MTRAKVATGVTERIKALYLGYSSNAVIRRVFLIVGLSLISFGVGSLLIHRGDMASYAFGFAAFWFVKGAMWSILKNPSGPR